MCHHATILDSEIFQFLVFYLVGRAKMHHRTKFHQNRSSDCRDIAFNLFFKMAAVRHVGFFKIWVPRANVHQRENFVEIGGTVTEI